MYRRLISYIQENAGSTLVPQKYDEDPELGRWVCRQRIASKKKELPKDRATLLKSIDFAWDGREAKENSNCMDMHQCLVSYKEEHAGSTMVPRDYDKYPKLGRWVST